MKLLKWIMNMTWLILGVILIQEIINDLTGYRPEGLSFMAGYIFYRLQIGRSWSMVDDDVTRALGQVEKNK
jgi:hypothetical protein